MKRMIFAASLLLSAIAAATAQTTFAGRRSKGKFPGRDGSGRRPQSNTGKYRSEPDRLRSFRSTGQICRAWLLHALQTLLEHAYRASHFPGGGAASSKITLPCVGMEEYSDRSDLTNMDMRRQCG
jgi:hypothetical protein